MPPHSLFIMARLARIVVPGLWHHITQRGNRRQAVFFDDQDREMYLGLLAHHTRRCSVRIAGYCLMSNHVHLIAIPSAETALARALGRAHVDYARWSNLRRGESGHLWQNRFFSCPMDDDHKWEALRYVECNPVRAGLVAEAAAWGWSSAAAHSGAGDNWGSLDMAEWKLGWTAAGWMEALRAGVANGALWERIREATLTGRPGGSDDFVRGLERDLQRILHPRKRGPKPKPTGGEPQLALFAG